MNLVLGYFRELAVATSRGWNRFWYTPTHPATLSLIRILAGAMLFYTHLVWSVALEDFFLPSGWLSPEAVARFHGDGYAWSHHWLIGSPSMLWITHGLALGVFALLTLGLYSRVNAVLAFLITVSYANRVPGALFGLDQINALLAMYLMLGPSGACYSLDRWLARRRGAAGPVGDSIAANVAIRLIQVHMCVIYLFAGLSKLAGPSWWAGTALWGAFANLEYQSLNMLWMVNYPLVVNLLTLTTLAWEISYCALVWPRLTRPIVIALAVPLHLGIAFCMGMITFGLVMLIGNAAFISPALVRAVIERRTLDDQRAEGAVGAGRSSAGRGQRIGRRSSAPAIPRESAPR